MKPLAKPTGVLLEDHIKNLLKQADDLLASRPFVSEKYKERTGKNLASELKQSACWHDEGKKHKDWQTPCRKDYEEFLRTGIDRAENLRSVTLRHEMASLEFIHRLNADVSLPVKVAVAAHHAKLSFKHEHRWHDRDEFQKFWEEFFIEHHTLRTSISSDFEKAISKRYCFAGPRAWLQLIDHRASAFEQNEPLPQFQKFYYKFPHTEKRGVQLEIEKLWDEPFAILRAPTGAGKTDAALLWAQHQIECKRADHLVIAMPTRFTANALSINVTQENFKNLGDAGLYHSSAWYQRLKDKENPTVAEKRFIDKEQELARRLETPLTVTTIDHLCICLTATREDHHAIFWGLAHSCVVIDEADFYDDFTQQNIVVLLRALRELKVPVLLMSATVPESAREVYATSGFNVPSIYEDKTDYERPRCHIKRYGKVEQPNDIEDLLERALDGEPTIIYANTVSRAQAYYQWFKGKYFDDVVLYHSRFVEPHKVEKENQLIKMLGRKAWKEGRQHGIAILTQIGEISVNISADLMISDLCPLDRLAQRAGRLSRFDERNGIKQKVIGELFIVEPQRLNKKGEIVFYPAPYGTYIPNIGWETSPALLKSGELLSNGDYSAKSFVDLVNQLYPIAQKPSQLICDNKRALEDCVVGNWLILPVIKVEQDDDHVEGQWRSRDIPSQSTVYAGYQHSGFIDELPQEPRNKTELREWEIRYGINIHSYEFDYAMKNDLLDPVWFVIGDEVVERLVVKSSFYNDETGLDFMPSLINSDYE